jgi:hypothetical protein
VCHGTKRIIPVRGPAISHENIMVKLNITYEPGMSSAVAYQSLYLICTNKNSACAHKAVDRRFPKSTSSKIFNSTE